MDDSMKPITTPTELTPAEHFSTASEVSSEGEKEVEGGNSTEEPHAVDTNSSLNAKRIEGEDVQVANQIINYNEIYAGREVSNLEVLGREHYKRMDELELSNRLRHFVFDEETMLSVADDALNSRLFILSGEPGLGKVTTMLKIAHQLWMILPKAPAEVLLFRTLGKDVRAKRIFSMDTKYINRILIFEDAFALDNRDLHSLIKELDAARIESLRQEMTRHGMFIFFTSNPDQLPKDARKLRSFGALREASPPAEKTLRIVLEHHSQRLCASWGEEERAAALNFLDKHSTEVITALNSPPRVCRFLDEYLTDLAMCRITLNRALARVDDLTGWLLEDLAKSPETFSFTVSLTLAYASPPLHAVPWFQFYYLFSQVASFLRNQLGDNERKLTIAEFGVDDLLLRRARAEVHRLAFPAADTVRFIDATYPERLWQVLLGPGRGLISLLIPLLKELVEQGDFYLREVAARALGRLGQIDPLYLVYPTIANYTRSAMETHHIALGELFQGILGARMENVRDETYVNGCLLWMRKVTGGGHPRNSMVRVICIREIGAFDLTLAVRELRQLIVDKLGDKASELSFFHHALRRLEASDRPEVAAAGRSSAIDDWHVAMLDNIAKESFGSRQWEIIRAVRYGIVGLCLVEDPIHVFSELYHWISGSDRGLAAMLALLFLDGHGIADILDRNKVPLALQEISPSRSSPSYSRILAAATLGRETETPLAQFLERIYGATREFPNPFRRRLRDNFHNTLIRWSKESVRYEETCMVMECILRHLLASRNSELKQEIFNLLQSRAFSEADSDLHRLMIRVMKSVPV